ncbi:hypothetical protein AMECASPLE_001868 [Ameca splendens]|uniref:Uncharacterized protein n=1 Tax=Ameca splendens TaxID=208324 RepID=A0ABV0YW39_9TELE
MALDDISLFLEITYGKFHMYWHTSVYIFTGSLLCLLFPRGSGQSSVHAPSSRLSSPCASLYSLKLEGQSANHSRKTDVSKTSL